MNILLATYLFYPEPIVMSTIVEDLAIELTKKHNVTVVTSRPCRPYGYCLPEKINKDNWPFTRVVLETYCKPKSEFLGRLKENLSFGRAVSEYIREHHNKIDIVYLNVFPLFSMKMIIKEAKKYRIATVNHIEDIYPEPFKQKIPLFGTIIYKFLLPLDKWIIKNTSTSIVIGNKIKDLYVSTRNADPIDVEVVNNWQDENRYCGDYSYLQQNEKFTFMYVGSLSKSANLHYVLRAFINADIRRAQLVFAGAGSEKKSLKKEVISAGVQNVKFIEAIPSEIGKIQATSDVLIMPLLPTVGLRAVPSKLAAYLFSHKPILACVEEESDAADIIKRSKCGWVVSSFIEKELSIEMKKITLLPKESLIDMGERGYSYSQNHLTKEINLRKLSDIVVKAYSKNI